MIYTVTLAARTGALERFLGICRRRGYRIARFDAVAGPAAWTITLTLDAGGPPPERMLPTLARDHDVLAIEPVADAVGRVSRSA